MPLCRSGPPRLGMALVPLSLALREEKKGGAGSGGAAGTLYISHNFDVCRGSLTQEVCHPPATKLDPRQLQL